MRLTWKVGAPTFVALLFSLALLGFLNLHKFEQLLDNLATSRIRVTAFDGKAAIEQSLALGLPLTDLQNIQSVIERAHSFDSEIVAVFVVDLDQARGDILYASGPRPAMAPALWQVMQARAGREGWHRSDDNDHLLMGWPLIDSLDRVVGMLVFDVLRQRQTAMVNDAAKHLVVVVVLLGLVLAIVTAVMMRRLLDPVECSLERAVAIIAGTSADRPQSDIEQLALAFREVVAPTHEKGGDRVRESGQP